MCGFILFYGEKSSQRMQANLSRLRHRGPDDSRQIDIGSISLGFHRLAINDATDQGMQPFEYKHITCLVNGEIYNHQELRNKHQLGDLESGSDCAVIAPLFCKYGANVIKYLDGFFAGILLDNQTGDIFIIRDKVGKKAVFVGKSGSETFIVSELKALDSIDSFQELPSGVCKIDLDKGSYDLFHDMNSEDTSSLEHVPYRVLLEQSVIKRLPERGLPFAVFLSGGLDSSIIAYIVSKHRSDAIYLCLANKDSADYKFVQLLTKTLNLKHVIYLPLPKEDVLLQLIECVVRASDSYNPSIISNGLGTYLLSQHAHALGIKVALSGEGADELFGGYHSFIETEPWHEMQELLISNMHFTELRRIDLCGMAHAVEIRCPFLDNAILSAAKQVKFSDLYDGNNNKIILRKEFLGLLPEEIIRRKKVSFDVGSGLRGKVIYLLKKISSRCSERELLRDIWQRNSNYAHLIEDPYFSQYPAFDILIDNRGCTHK